MFVHWSQGETILSASYGASHQVFRYTSQPGSQKYDSKIRKNCVKIVCLKPAVPETYKFASGCTTWSRWSPKFKSLFPQGARDIFLQSGNVSELRGVTVVGARDDFRNWFMLFFDYDGIILLNILKSFLLEGSKEGCLLKEVILSVNGNRPKQDMSFERTQSSRGYQLLDSVWDIFKQI